MGSETPQNRGQSRACPSSRSSRRRWPCRNHGRNLSNPSQSHSAEPPRDQHSFVGGGDSIIATHPLQQANHQLLQSYNIILQRIIVVTQELNLLNQYLKALQPVQSSNEMDWEPIPPTHSFCVRQQQ